jgi:hypothetical protein
MNRIGLVGFLCVIFISAIAMAYEGFGGNVTGGSGYGSVAVNNLNDSGAGSLRAALSGSNRVITFNVSGTINLLSAIWVTGRNITVNGFSAHGNGITISSSSDAFVVSGKTYGGPDNATGVNIVFSGLRIRSTQGDAFQIAYNAHDVVVDHCSINGAGDGSVDVTEGAYNVTVSYSIVSNGSGNGPFLIAFDTNRISIHHNIMYNNRDRNPIAGASHNRYYSSGPAYNEDYPLLDSRYNVIWNYVIGSYVMSEKGVIGKANFISNIYKCSGTNNPSNNIGRSSHDSTSRALAYIAGNVSVHDMRGRAYNYGSGSNRIPDSVFITNKANDFNSQGTIPFNSPMITGPSLVDSTGHIKEWQNVVNTAGLIGKYTDDLFDAKTRAGITIPLDVFNYVWNSDAIVRTLSK